MIACLGWLNWRVEAVPVEIASKGPPFSFSHIFVNRVALKAVRANTRSRVMLARCHPFPPLTVASTVTKVSGVPVVEDVINSEPTLTISSSSWVGSKFGLIAASGRSWIKLGKVVSEEPLISEPNSCERR